MLQSLTIRDFAIVQEAQIDFHTGLTLFTGETGAGKSILLDALGLCLGARAESYMIREGADKVDISACFTLNERLQQWCHEQSVEDDLLIIRRTYDRQGKSRAWINGRPTILTQLKELSPLLVHIHGQHSHQNLLNRAYQLQCLDTYTFAMEKSPFYAQRATKQALAQAYQAWTSKRQAWQQALADQAFLQQKSERLQWQLQEISQLQLQPDEWVTLSEKHSRLANAAKLMADAQEAIQGLEEDRQGVIEQLGNCLGAIERMLRHDPSLQSLYDSVDSALITCKEVAQDLTHYMQDFDLDEQQFEWLEQRISAIFGLARRLQIAPEDLYPQQQAIQAELDQLTQQGDIEQLAQEVQALEQAYQQLAQQVSTWRQTAAPLLCQQMDRYVAQLGMQNVRHQIVFTSAQPSASGIDHIEIQVSANQGKSYQGMQKVASGGELSRISLALALSTTTGNGIETLIFDEVDTGIGGAVADMLGRMLQTLGQQVQVLCVSHLANVAAYADHHFLVQKSMQAGQPISTIEVLNETQTVKEIARMLGGDQKGTTAHQHAQELLTQARR